MNVYKVRGPQNIRIDLTMSEAKELGYTISGMEDFDRVKLLHPALIRVWEELTNVLMKEEENEVQQEEVQ